MNTDTMQAGPETSTETTGSTQPSAPAKPARKPSTKPAKKSSAKLVKKAVASKSTAKSSPDGTPLKNLLAKLKLPADGRAARRKLRAANFTWHDKRTRWNLNAKQLAQAEAILRGEE